MAQLIRLLLSFLLLSSLLVISSASYNYPYTTQQPNYVEHDKQTLLDHEQPLDNTLLPTNLLDLGSTNRHNYEQYDHHVLHDDQQNLIPDQLLDNRLDPTIQDQHYQQYYRKSSEGKEYFVPSDQPAEYYEKPMLEGKENVILPTKLPYHGEPKSYDQAGHVPAIKYVAIRGLVLCNSGQSYAPLKGAKARIICEAKKDKNGYEKTASPVSIVTDATDENGFFFKTLSLSYVHQVKLNLDECKVYLEAPPSECSCKVATDVNYGKSGAHLSMVRILNDKFLYTVGPFIYTSYSSPSKPAVPKAYSAVPGGY